MRSAAIRLAIVGVITLIPWLTSGGIEDGGAGTVVYTTPGVPLVRTVVPTRTPLSRREAQGTATPEVDDPSLPADWRLYENRPYGFAMAVPEGWLGENRTAQEIQFRPANQDDPAFISVSIEKEVPEYIPPLLLQALLDLAAANPTWIVVKAAEEATMGGRPAVVGIYEGEVQGVLMRLYTALSYGNGMSYYLAVRGDASNTELEDIFNTVFASFRFRE